MATPPVFSAGSVLTAGQMNAVGLWLVKSQTVGSGVTSVTVSNAFSSDFVNYKIMYSGGSLTNDTYLTMQLGSSTTAYYGAFQYSAYSGPLNITYDSNASAWHWVGGGVNGNTSMTFDLLQPYLSAYTYLAGAQTIYASIGTFNGVHVSAASYTSFKIGVDAGTMTGGTISVYGYRQ